MRKNFACFSYSPSETVRIANDVWIGDGVYIKAGLTIGSGAIIGAHAVVTHDVEPYAIVAGVPAIEIRKRFDKSIIEELLKLAWWDWPDNKLKKYSNYFDSPESLIRAIRESG